jgi:hypothetical protein
MTTFIATFHPQAWVNDYATPVDPKGETTWDVTAELLAMPEADRAKALIPDQYESDDLRYATSAPAWVKDWTGPFYISVEESQ